MSQAFQKISEYKLMQEKYLQWIGIVILSLILPLINDFNPERSYWEELIPSLFFVIIYWQGCRAIMFYVRELYPEFHQNVQRIFIEVLFCLIYTSLIVIIIDVLILHYLFPILASPNKDESIFTAFKVPLIASLFIGSLYESTYFFEKWKITIREAEDLKRQHIQSQLQALKTQVNPHFLFNSLNTLVTIIPETPELAVKFTEKLSEVYRYILQNREQELISVKQELEFIDSYLFLLSIRFGKNLKIQIEIENAIQAKQIPPLTLQILVENAIKHNIVSQTKPLSVHIFVNPEGQLVVENNLQKKRTNEAEISTKFGLENIRKRYQYLSNQEIAIQETRTDFSVSLPLLS